MITYIKTLLNDPKAARKAIVALAGALVVIAAQGLLPVAIAGWVSVVGGLITAGGVWVVPNSTPVEDTQNYEHPLITR